MFINHSHTNATSTSASGSQARLEKAAGDGIRAIATEDSDLGPVDGNNCGMAAYSLSPQATQNILAVAKDIYPGAKSLQAYRFNAASTNMIAVVTSEDEPHVRLFPQSKAQGALGPELIAINTADILYTKEPLFAKAFPGASNEDIVEPLTAFFRDQRHLDLGEGSAGHLWWD